jgi:hypothetical protein
MRNIEVYAYVLPEDILQQPVAKLSEQALLAVILWVLT